MQYILEILCTYLIGNIKIASTFLTDYIIIVLLVSQIKGLVVFLANITRPGVFI